MATAKKAAPAAPKKSAKAATPAAKPAPATMKPIKEALSKTALVAHLATHSGVEPKAVKAVMGALEATMFASLGKKGQQAFVLPGLLKIAVQHVPARKAYKGIDRFTKQERVFAAKKASVKVKVRALKKLKDAAA